MKLKPFIIGAVIVLLVIWAGYMLVLRGPAPLSDNGGDTDRSVAALIEAWPDFEKTIPERPVLGSTKWNYPATIQFLRHDRLFLEYDDGHILHYSIVSYDGSTWKHEETLPKDKLTAEDWTALKRKYSNNGFEPVTYQYSPANPLTPAQAADWKRIETNPYVETSKIYSNDALSFLYPADLSIEPREDELFTACKDFAEPIKIESCVFFAKELNIVSKEDLTEKSYEPAILSDVIFDGSGEHPESLDEFSKVVIGSHEYYAIKTGRFEGQLSYNYYLPVGPKVYVFGFRSMGVDWTNPELDEQGDPGHVLLREILSTVDLKG